MTMNDDEKRALEHWSNRLSHALQILDLKEENDLILKLAEDSSARVSPSAGPISAFYIGYAAALGATSGHIDPQQAVKDAAHKAIMLSQDGPHARPDDAGWAATGQ